MSGDRRADVQLTDRQRRLVRENIGLVTVHLRRHIHDLSVPRRDCEWEDLFQEGCVGLIKAATTFRQDAGIPFAAFALPRIHHAVSCALHSKFSTVYVPPKRPFGTRNLGAVHHDQNHDRKEMETSGSPLRGPIGHRPRVHSLSDELKACLTDKRRHDPDPGPDGSGVPARRDETIGERLRAKYERAVRAAADAMFRSARSGQHKERRGDRSKLIRILMEERFLIPDEEFQTSFHQIARQTKSSYARVRQCAGGFSDRIRRRLEADPEFCELRRRTRANPDGPDVCIDFRLERELAAASAEEFVRRLRAAAPHDRTCLLDALLQTSTHELEDVLRQRVARLAAPMRELLLQSHPGAPGSGRSDDV